LLSGRHIPANDAVEIFVDGLFDYAGLFPPARLPLEEALHVYAANEAGEDRWMSGPFVCSVDTLSGIVASGLLAGAPRPLRVSLLLSAPNSLQETERVWQRDTAALAEVLGRSIDTAGKGAPGETERTAAYPITVDALELRLPGDAVDSEGAISDAFAALEKALSGIPGPQPSVFMEIARNASFRERLEILCRALTGSQFFQSAAGLKLRCGGMKEVDFPTPGEVAVFLSTVIASGHRFKATAGLHHPVRHFNSGQGVMMHGFLNVFFAAALFAEEMLGDDRLVEVIADEDPTSFTFYPDGIAWRELAVSVPALRRIRRQTALSIGSCSFDEPREDLTALGWLRT
jgi:hypothetical protein